MKSKYHSVAELLADRSRWGGKRMSLRRLSDLTESATGRRVGYSTIHMVATGKSPGSVETLQRIAAAAGLRWCWYFTADEDCDEEEPRDRPDESTPL